MDNQCTGGNIPRFEVELEETVQTAGRNGTQIQRSRAFTTAAGGFGQEIFQNRQILVHHALIDNREAGTDQAAVQFDAVGNTDAAVVEQRAFAAGSHIYVVALRCVHQSFLQHAFVQECHRDGVLGMAVEEVGRAVERVDNPFVLGSGFTVGASFFASDFVMRIGFFERFHQNHFGAAVNIGNEVVECFAVYFDGIQIAGGANHHLPCFTGGFKSGI